MRSLFNRIEGYYNLVQQQEQNEWERTRWLATLVVGMFAKKGKRIKPKDLAVFPWEGDKAPPRPTPRKLTPQEIREKFAEADRKKRLQWQGAS